MNVLQSLLPKDDPNSLTCYLGYIQDDEGRRVEYQQLAAGALLQARSDEVYNTGGSTVSYLQTDYAYDTDATGSYTHGWLKQVTNAWYYRVNGVLQPAQPVSQNAYAYDNTAGNRTSNQVWDQTGSLVRTETYGYDDLYRLASVNYGDGQTQSYAFDAMGNRLSRQDSAAGATNYAYDAANRLTGTTGAGASAYSNDLDGNTLSGGGRTNTWDSQNRLTQCAYGGTTSAFTYGADGLRRRATVNGTATDYALDGQMAVRELRGGSRFATYLTGPRGPECRVAETGTPPPHPLMVVGSFRRP